MTSEVKNKNDQKGSKPKTQTPKNTWDVKFVACELDKETRATVKALPVVPVEILDGLVRMVDSGYKISFNYEQRNDCVGAYATAPSLDHAAHGLCLSARGPDALSALKVLLYKHYVILDGVWTTPVDRDHDGDTWG